MGLSAHRWSRANLAAYLAAVTGMELCLILALVLGGTSVATSASLQKIPESGRDALTIAKAIEIYNREPGVAYFKLFESDPDGSLEMLASPEQLRFTIKETVCVNQMDNQRMDKCDFKDSGTVRDCRATVSSVLGDDVIMVICDPVTAKIPVRTPRQATQCVLVNNKRICRPRPGFGSVVAGRTGKDVVI